MVVLKLRSGNPFTVIESAGGSAYGLSSPNLRTPLLIQPSLRYSR
jgi:hypothetical protein